MSRRFLIHAFAVSLAAAAVAGTSRVVVIGFDDLPAQGGLVLVDDEYRALEVVFDSGGGGAGVVAPGNPVSPPNVATATAPGPVVDFELPVTAQFVDPAGGVAVARAASLSLTSTSQSSALEAFDCFGQLVDVSVGAGGSTLAVGAAEIRWVTIQQGPMAFDDFTFEGLRAAAPRLAPPSPGTAGALNTFTVGCAQRRHLIVFLIGLAPGSSSLGGCPGLTLGLARPRPLGTALVNANGIATLDAFVPGSVGGLTVWLQAVDPLACVATEAVAFAF